MAYVANYPPASAYDLQSEVRTGKAISLSYGEMQFKTRDGDVVSPYQTLIGRFYHSLSNYIVDRTLTKEELAKYHQRPKLFCQDTYGTPELWSGLLFINNMVSVTNFTKADIKVFTTGITEALQEIMTIYHDDLVDNKATVYSE